nr:PRELI domain containing protein 1 mitochondrial [Hymenolepis microstoma]
MEESIIDLEKKEILTSTRNFGGLSGYAVLVEDCRYAPSHSNPNATTIARHVELKSSLGTRVLYPLWSFLNRRYLNSADKSLKGYRLICQQFAGEIGSNSMTSIKLANRLKEFALKKRPRVMRAQADCDDLD